MGVVVSHRYTGIYAGMIGVSVVTGTIGTAATSGSVVLPAPNLNLSMFNLALSDNATLGTAGITTITFRLNGVTFFTEGIYLPSAPGSQVGSGYIRVLGGNNIAVPTGNAPMTWTLSTALTAGSFTFNAYFTP